MKNIALPEITKGIIDKIKDYSYITYKPEWVNTTTDLYNDLKLSWNEIIMLLLDLEEEFNTSIISIPLCQSSFKISYIAKLINHSLSFDKEIYEKELLEYAVKNVASFRDNVKQNENINEIKFNDIDWNGEYHINSNEFDNIADIYYSDYSYGRLICKNVLDLHGVINFSIMAPMEALLSELQIWKKRVLWYNICPGDKVVRFLTSNYVGNRLALPMLKEIITEKGLELIFFESAITRETIESFYVKIYEFEPKWIVGDSCIIYNLSLYMLEHNLSLKSVSYIEVESNNLLSDDFKEIIEKAFKNVILAISLVDSHAGSFLLTCPEGHFHQVSNSLVVINKLVEHNKENEYADILISSLLNVTAPLINKKTFLRGFFLQDKQCGNLINDLIFIIMPTNGFGGFIDSSNWAISAKVISMCIALVNTEYNNPISAIQITQTKPGFIRIYMEIQKKFINWEKALSTSLHTYLTSWGSKYIEWEIIMLDKLYPCEYTGILSYYQNNSL